MEKKLFNRRRTIFSLICTIGVVLIAIYFILVGPYLLKEMGVGVAQHNSVKAEVVEEVKAKPIKVVKKELSLHDLKLATGVLFDLTRGRSCGATVIEKKGKTSLIVTALHCVGGPIDKTGKAVPYPVTLGLYLEGSGGSKYFYLAKLVKMGIFANLNDIAFLEVEIKRPFLAIPLAKPGPKLGEKFYIFTKQFDKLKKFGLQLIEGHVSIDKIPQNTMLKVHNSGSINVGGSALIRIVGGVSVGLGLSGTAVISQERKEIIGLISLSIPYDKAEHSNFVIVPVSKIRKLFEKIKERRRMLIRKVQEKHRILFEDLINSMRQ